MVINFVQQPWVLGLFAGSTIFLGFPVARIKSVSTRTKAFLNAISTGILIFLLVEITGHVLERIEELIQRVAVGQPGLHEVVVQGGLFAGGFSIGLLGLVFFERRYLGSAKDIPQAKRSRRVATMIALGLGLHNFSEGLAIGQGYASGALQLAWLLAIGFALHNATEGFGIAAPLSGERASWGFLFRAGLLAGGPTVLGALFGGWWVNKSVETFCLAMAAGTILYVIGELLHLGRQLKEEWVVATGLLAGFFIAVMTDFFLIAAMQHASAKAAPPPAAQASADITAAEYHKPRHGGLFGDADDVYHYEVLLNDKQQLVLYVNDAWNRPLNVRDLAGRFRLDPDSKKPKEGSFSASPDGAYLIGNLPPTQSDPVHVEVSVRKGQIWAPMEFYIPHPKS